MSGTYTFDSYVHFAGGMNSGFNPANLEPSQYAKGVNIVVRDGRATTRPSFTTLSLEFTSNWDRLRFQRGKFQGSELYKVNNADFLVTVISGIVFLVRTDTGRVYNMSSMSRNLRQYVDRCYFLQVNDYMIVQDGTSRPLIIEGMGIRASDPDKDEVPPGTAMTYGHGRLFVKVGTQAFRAGDIVQPNDASSILRFTEHRQFALGGTLMVNQELGEIQALTFAANFDTSTGDGPLLAMCDNGVVSFRVDVNRDKWLDTIFSKTQVIGSGLVGPSALAHMNSDVLFWSTGGLRSFSVLKSEVTSARRQVNLSREMIDVERKETNWLRPLASMTTFDGRVLLTTGAQKHTAEDTFGQDVNDYSFQGVIVVDFDQMAGHALEGRYSTIVSFDGVWTGPAFTQILASDRMLYAFTKTSTGENALTTMDGATSGFDDDRAIECRLITRAMATKSMPDMQDAPFVPKLYDRLELWVDELRGTVPFTLWAALDGRRLFTKLAERTIDVDMLDWTPGSGETPTVGVAQPFPALRFAMPQYACDAGSGNGLLSGYIFQFAFEWSGMVSISRMLFRALDQQQMPDAVTDRDLSLVPMDAPRDLHEHDFEFSV